MSSLDSIAVAPEEPKKLILKSPVTGDPITNTVTGEPAFILLLGKDSKAAKAHERAMTQKFLDKRGRGKTKAEELESSGVELLVKLTKGWGLVNFEGEPIDFEYSEANARALYANPVFSWIREQADEFAGDRAGFLKSSATSS